MTLMGAKGCSAVICETFVSNMKALDWSVDGQELTFA